jgi:hypothetical protein|tara:strand:+ start:532 stop:807 length:276 start_codon:yes stop_codon:yes gene_type:complete
MKKVLISANPPIYDYISDDDSDDDNITEIVIIHNQEDTIINLICRIENAIKDGNEIENIYVFVSSHNEDYDDIVSLIKSIYQNIKIITEVD